LGELVRRGYALEYVVVGDGPCRSELMALAREEGVSECVRFAGEVAPDELSPYYDGCDIFVLPSVSEPFGLVFIEALAFGKPVIACEGTGGPEDLAALGDCVALVQPHDVRSLANTLSALMADPQRCMKMGERGRKVVRSHYSWGVTANELCGVYREMINT